MIFELIVIHIVNYGLHSLKSRLLITVRIKSKQIDKFFAKLVIERLRMWKRNTMTIL